VPSSRLNSNPLRILLLENSPADAELCIHELQRAGLDFHHEIAQDLEEFRSMVHDGSFDLVISDYNLGGATGVEAFEHLKSLQNPLPFILITGAIGDEVAVECMKRGISDYVLKDRLARLPVAIRRTMAEEELRKERVEAEKLLIERERRFRALMEHSTDGIVLLNRDGEIAFTSHAQAGVLGYSASDVVAKSIFELMHPDDTPQASAQLEQLLNSPGISVTAHLRFRAKEGYWRWLECIAINLLSEPSVGGIVVNYRDISDRKRSEEEIRRLNDELESRVEERTAQLEAANQELQIEIAERRKAEKILRESQERFRLLVDGVKDYAIYMLSPEGRVASWNTGAERIYGYRAAEIIGRDFSCFYSEEDLKAGLPQRNAKLAAETGRLETEGWRIRKDGSLFWANVVMTALYDPAGKLRGFSKVTRDITERRRTEQALEQLRRQQQLILNSAGEGICGLDHSGACTFVNPSGAQMLGRKQDELIGQPLHDCIHHSKPDGAPHLAAECQILAALRDGRSHHANNEVLWRKDGSNFPVEYVSTPIRTEQGQIVGAVIVFQDITERRAIEHIKDEFISVVSHELRTPLTAIRGALGLLASGKLCAAPGGCQRMIGVAVSNAGRLARLVNDILDLERIESGKAQRVQQVCDAGDLMKQAADLVRVTAEAQGISLSIHPASAQVQGDPDRIMQVLLNLLSNAIKFSPRSSSISLSAKPEAREVTFRVEDHGRGIPASKLATIFDKFQQVDASDSRDKGGTGLGLAICRSIVAQHGGRIWVESIPGQGSTFVFTLPRVDPPISEDRGAECIEKS
jgi:two-component system sensor histidine kinase VicK